jgi:hypothetical protein
MKVHKMEAKKFIITSIILVIIVSIVTSYVTYLYLKGVGGISGMAGTDGSLTFGDLGSNLNVILVENADSRTVGSDTDYGIPGKTVSFSSVAIGGTYATDMVATLTNPYPFLIRNIGGDNANVEFYAESEILTSPTSKIEFWVEQGRPVSGGASNWDKVDNCGTSCFTSTSYTGDGGTNDCETNPTSCCTTSSYCLEIGNAIGSGNKKTIIQSLKTPVLTNEALLHVKVSVGNAEGSGSKSGIIHINGVSAT